MNGISASGAQKDEDLKVAMNTAFPGWFPWDKIHSIERRALPEIFGGKSVSKTPRVYKEYRNFIIKRYMDNPQRSLIYSEVRKMLLGDVNLIRKVFDYVEYWGFINNHGTLGNKSQMGAPEIVLVPPISGSVPPGIRIVYPCKIVHPKGQVTETERPAVVSNVASHKDLFVVSYAENVRPVPFNESVDNSIIQSCSNCRVHDQSKWFEKKDEAGFILCEACFLAGDAYFKDEFILTRTSDRSDDNNLAWTKEEMLRLLEAIVKHGENWDLVAIHVGTKSKAECVMYFMKLPFGDQFRIGSTGFEPLASKSTGESMVKNTESEKRQNSGHGEAHEIHDSEELLESIEDADGPPTKWRRLNSPPDSSNPILDQAALLSAVVAPSIAAAAAQAV